MELDELFKIDKSGIAMDIIFLSIVFIGLACLFLLAFSWVVKSILLYMSAKETEATVVDRHEDGRWYKVSVEIEEHGEKRIVKSMDFFRIRLDDNLKIGDKIVVWYSKKFKLCACNRSNLLIFGLFILLMFAPLIACIVAYIV